MPTCSPPKRTVGVSDPGVARALTWTVPLKERNCTSRRDSIGCRRAPDSMIQTNLNSDDPEATRGCPDATTTDTSFLDGSMQGLGPATFETEYVTTVLIPKTTSPGRRPPLLQLRRRISPGVGQWHGRDLARPQRGIWSSRSPGLRRAIEPVEPRALASFLPEWQGLRARRRGRDALLAVVGELEGCPLVVSALEDGDPPGAPRRVPRLGPRRTLRLRRGRVGGRRGAGRERRAHRALPRRSTSRCSPGTRRRSRGRRRRPARAARTARGGLLRRRRSAPPGGFPERRARRPLADGLVGRGHQRHARAAAQPRARPRERGPAEAAPAACARAPHRSAGQRGALVAPRLPLGRATESTPTVAPPWRARCSIATAS